MIAGSREAEQGAGSQAGAARSVSRDGHGGGRSVCGFQEGAGTRARCTFLNPCTHSSWWKRWNLQQQRAETYPSALQIR
jgi:hypothetical protein